MGVFLRGKDFVIHSKELECIKTPKIIHFADVLKPWFKECDNPYKGLYWYYLGLTPWANDKASYKYKLAKRILLYIKRYLKHILSLLGFRRYIQFNLILIKIDYYEFLSGYLMINYFLFNSAK